MRVTYGSTRAETAPTQHECILDELDAWLRSRPPHVGEKDGPWLCFAAFDGQRSLATLQGSYAVPLDFDTHEPDLTLLAGYAHFRWTTHGHTPDAPRWRVVVPVDRPMSAAEHRATWECLAAMFPGADPAAKDASRLNYLPGACLVPQAAQYHYAPGALFPVCAAVDVPAGTADDLTAEPVPGWDGPTDDDQLIAYMRANRRSAEDAFGTTTRFEALWTADAAYLAVKFPHAEQGFDHTKADAALANELAYYTGGHGERCMDLFARSALAARESWRPDKARRAILLACTGRTQYAFMRSVSTPPDGTGATPSVSDAAAAPAPAIPDARHLTTDLANAQRLLRTYSGRLLSAAGEFFTWTGTHWQPGMREPTRLGCTLSAIIAEELKPLRDRLELLKAGAVNDPRAGEEWEELDRLVEALQKWGAKSEQASVVGSALGLLKSMLDVPMTSFDSDPWLLNTLSGTIDLRTGALQPHNLAHRITRVIPLKYDPGAKAPRWQRFISEVFPDPATAHYLHKYCGYSATGDNREQSMLVHWGGGSNGKNTLLKTVRAVLGPYAMVGGSELLTVGKSGAMIHEIADLYGARLVTIDETEDGARLNESAFKRVTGDDEVKGRHLYKSFFQYLPTYKLHLLTNHKPRVVNTDNGVWRRLKLLPYTQAFTEENGRLDVTLSRTLETEREGILAWIVEGARLYAAEGLKASPEVLQASAQYRRDEDLLGQFVDEKCVADPAAQVTVAALYTAYAGWARENGAFIVSKKRLVADIMERPMGLRKITAGDAKAVTLVGMKLAT